jgi:hypothetical protein
VYVEWRQKNRNLGWRIVTALVNPIRSYNTSIRGGDDDSTILGTIARWIAKEKNHERGEDQAEAGCNPPAKDEKDNRR